MALRQRARVLLLLLRAPVKRPAGPRPRGKKKTKKTPGDIVVVVVGRIGWGGGGEEERIKSTRISCRVENLLNRRRTKVRRLDGAAKIAPLRAELLNGERQRYFKPFAYNAGLTHTVVPCVHDQYVLDICGRAGAGNAYVPALHLRYVSAFRDNG